jgi:3-hydroxyisobutyrate dehydrogenase-like beta-hydroxyacid dehydrogenase
MHAGYLGVGSMGQPMAGKILDAGHTLSIYDVSEANMKPLLDRQARRAATVKELGYTCETVFVSVPTLKILRDVVLGPGGLVEGSKLKLLVNTCTVGVPLVEEMAKACAARGITLLDCPISGGPAGARAGTLSIMMSGDPKAREAVRPLIAGWGKTLVVAGDKPGAAQVLKLTNNVLYAVSLVASCEAFVMGAKGGLSPQVMLDAINAGSGRSYSTQTTLPNYILPRTFDMGGALAILVKDVDLAIEQGDALGIPMWVCQAARLALKHALFEGRGNEDITRFVETIERGAGFEIPKMEKG